MAPAAVLEPPAATAAPFAAVFPEELDGELVVDVMDVPSDDELDVEPDVTPADTTTGASSVVGPLVPGAALLVPDPPGRLSAPCDTITPEALAPVLEPRA